METKVYPGVSKLLIASIISIIGAVCTIWISALGSICSLVALVFQMIGLSNLRPHNERFGKAFKYIVINIALSIISVLLAVATGASAVAGVAANSDGTIIAAGIAGILTLVLAVASFVFGLLASFNIYWGLDEMVTANGYNYPPQRIRWGFWLILIELICSTFLGFLLGSMGVAILTIVCLGVTVFLLYTYSEAVKAAEGV